MWKQRSGGGLLEQRLTLHPVLFHVLDLSDALAQVGGEASSVLLAGCREDDQHLPLAARIGRRQSDSVGVVLEGGRGREGPFTFHIYPEVHDVKDHLRQRGEDLGCNIDMSANVCPPTSR